MTADSLLTVNEVADLAKVSERTVWRWVEDGRLEPVRLSVRLVRFRPSDVDAFLNLDEAVGE